MQVWALQVTNMILLPFMVLYSFHKVNKMNAQQGDCICPVTYFISRMTQQIQMKFGIESWHAKLFGKFNFGPYQSSITSALHEP
jgi:hypothetical protein